MSPLSSTRRRTARRAAPRLAVEPLEDRCVPAMYAVTDLGVLGSGIYTNAADLNQAGQVVGSSGDADGHTHGFLWENGTMIDLGTLGGSYSWATAVNDLGQVVGSAYLPEDASYHAFLVNPQGAGWFQDSDLDGRNDFMMDLGTLRGSPYSDVTDINNAGQVVGSSDGDAFLWDAANGMRDLGAPMGFTNSYAAGVNEIGQVTGSAWYFDPAYHSSAFSLGRRQRHGHSRQRCGLHGQRAAALSDVRRRVVGGRVEFLDRD